eukprot:GHVR01065153.1.p1 GENE.GHVR01065153.1~~GHVR01065153.1.p1  ORF type:complete len:382 (+),score=46.00 GHVR01065153.1:1186-2331(+)
MNFVEEANATLQTLRQVNPTNQAVQTLHMAQKSLGKWKSGVSPSQWRGLINWREVDYDGELWSESFYLDSKLSEDHITRSSASLPLSILHSIARGARVHENIGSLLTKESLCVHMVGVRGDLEMQSSLSILLDRLPHLKTLTWVAVGFTSQKKDNKSAAESGVESGIFSDDKWSLSMETERCLSSKMLSKKRGNGEQCVRLYKGNYFEFLEDYEDSFQKEGIEPDFVVAANKSFTSNLSVWAPTVAAIANRRWPLLVLGVSAPHELSCEAAYMHIFANAMGAPVCVPLERNPHVVWATLKKPAASPDTESTCSVTRGNNAVGMWIHGTCKPADTREEALQTNMELDAPEIPSYRTEASLLELKEKLASMGIASSHDGKLCN